MRFSSNHQLGLVAQEVKEVLPDIVTQDLDGYLSVDYTKLTPLLIEAIKSQQTEIEQLQKQANETETLSERIVNLEKILESLLEGK